MDSGDRLVELARETAIAMHDGCRHMRSDGQPYWTHPERVVATLRTAGLGADVLAAAWLHDVAEDCPASLAECEALIEKLAHTFGPAVGSLVREVTNYFPPDAQPPATMEEKQARLREHAPHLSAGAKWIKLADRLDNISGMTGWPWSKRQRYARATELLLAALEPLPTGSDSLAEKIRSRTARVLDETAD